MSQSDARAASQDSTAAWVLPLVWLLVATWVIGSLAVLGMVAFGFMKYAVPLLSPKAVLTAEWRTRLAQDYPGWTVTRMDRHDLSGSNGDRTYYHATMMPAGWSSTILVEYASRKGGQPEIQDEVMRTNGVFHGLSGSLLAYLKRNYVDDGKQLDVVTSDLTPSVVVEWHRPQDSAGPSAGKIDGLWYDEDTGAWQLSDE